MDTNANEIEKAIEELKLSPERFRHLSAEDSLHIYESALRHFVPKGRPRWWWEHFQTSTSVHFDDGNGWKLLSKLVPDPDERVWFIAEDFAPPEYSVWEASVRDIQTVLAKCHNFEFYVIQKQFRWLLCENHHDVLVAVGAEVEQRLSDFVPHSSVDNSMRLSHINITMPKGSEDLARSFYTGLLGLREIPKPESIRHRGGVWFEAGGLDIHVSVEEPRTGPDAYRHFDLECQDIDAMRGKLQSAGIPTEDGRPVPWRRFFVHDPFGNRIEIHETGGLRS